MDEYQIPRMRMIERLREHYKIRDEKVLDVMSFVPRHLFVPEALKSQSYKDNALPIASNQTISQPFIVARMTELLELNPQSRILEIGAGSGYQSVILSKLCRKVYAIERVANLAAEAEERLKKLNVQNVVLRCADGTSGWELNAPFDGILVAAGSPATVPPPLLNQLKIGGRLIIPIGEDQKTQKLICVTRAAANDFQTEDFGACAFVPLIGEYGWQ